MSDNEHFDTDLFIAEIHNFPCIWDKRSDDYANRSLKNKAWETLCKKFYEDFHSKKIKEKDECATHLQKKWKSLRDSYIRDLKKVKSQKSGSGAGSSRRYQYFSQLSFLKPLNEKEKTASALPTQNNDHIEHINNEESATTDRGFKMRPRNHENNQDDAEYGVTHSSDRVSHKQEPADSYFSCDSDKHFLLSLYDRFKAIRNDNKLNAQIEILNVIKKYTSPTDTTLNDNDNNYEHNVFVTTAHRHQRYERPRMSKSMLMENMQTDSQEHGSMRTALTPRGLKVESPSSASSQSSTN